MLDDRDKEAHTGRQARGQDANKSAFFEFDYVPELDFVDERSQDKLLRSRKATVRYFLDATTPVPSEESVEYEMLSSKGDKGSEKSSADK
jgi:hypothetical protein